MRNIYVKSNYRSKWIGIVLDVIERDNYEPLYKVLILLDKNGNRMRKRKIVTYSSHYFEILNNLNLNINKDWYEI